MVEMSVLQSGTPKRVFKCICYKMVGPPTQISDKIAPAQRVYRGLSATILIVEISTGMHVPFQELKSAMEKIDKWW